MTQRLTVAVLVAALGGVACRPTAGRATGAGRRSAAGHVPRRSELRRSRRLRHRRAGQRRHQSHDERLRGLRGRQAAEDLLLLARQHSDRARRAAAVRGQADRAGRADQRASRGTHLSDRARRRAHRLHADAARKAATRRFIEQNFGTNDLAAVVFTGRSRRLAGFHQQPAAAAGGHRQVQRTQAAIDDDPADRERARSIPRPASSSPATTSTRWIAHSARAR